MTTDSEKKNIIKSILNLRCRDGATIDDIESKLWNNMFTFLCAHFHCDF